MKHIVKLGISSLVLFCTACGTTTKTSLFDGSTLNGWEGSQSAFRVEDGSIIGGNQKYPLDDSYYLCTEEKYGDFDLTLLAKFNDEKAIGNAGVSFRANRVTNSNEVAGYQADIGHIEPKYIPLFSDYTPADMTNPFSLWGSLVDENRTDTSRYPSPKVFPVVYLRIADRSQINKIVKLNDWNEIRIIANGKNIEIRINGITTVKFTETKNIPSEGYICLQVHSGGPFEIQYKDLKISKL